jgi:hypothetical protein
MRKPLDQERWDWRIDENGDAEVVTLSENRGTVAIVGKEDAARRELVVDAPALLSALMRLYQAHVGMEAACHPDQRIEDAKDLIAKYRRINHRLCSERAVH